VAAPVIRPGAGRQQCPSSAAPDKAQARPALTRSGLSGAIPAERAMASAVLNPIPHTPAASRYGSPRTTETDAPPYFLQIRTASDVDAPTPCRKIITSLIAFCPAQARRPGSSSMTCMMPAPNRATMRSAMTGPMPLISPEPRHFWMPAAVADSTVA
jgi:hypothetical protein